MAKRVEAKVAEGDVRGAVRIICSEDTLAPFNDETRQRLMELHPAQASTLPVATESAHFQVSEVETKGAIVSFPPGSAGGIDMMRPQHLKDLIGSGVGVAGQRLLSSIRNLCNAMLSGRVPPEIVPILYGASLCALSKKDGGIRPIAVGSMWRRLVAKMGSHHIMPKLAESFQPIQMGFGTKGGAEAAAHAARRYVAFPHKETKIFLKIDFRNAFNTVNRSLLLQSVAEQLPELYPFLYQCYGSPTHLAFGEELLSSQGGIQQGDPLGPALFCLMVHPIASSLHSELNVWYLDDAALGGQPEVVLEDFKILSSKAFALGLEVNPSKCELFPLDNAGEVSPCVRGTFQGVAPGIRFPEYKDFTLLGTPLVSEALAGGLDGKAQALKRLSERLDSVNAHVAFYLLKNSLAIPKLSYILRCAPTWRCEEGLKKFDDILKQALEAVSNTHLEDDAWEQSALPVAKGGLGLRQAKALSVPAFLASVHSVATITDALLPPEVEQWGDPLREEGIGLWRDRCGTETPDDNKNKFQREWEAPGVELLRVSLYNRAATLSDKARLLGVASKESGAFLNALPSSSLGTLMDNNSFRIAVALRLGAQICQAHSCICGSVVDGSGVHGLSCVKSAGRISRHAAVNDLIKRGLGSANIPAVLEPFHLSSGNSRPDGVTQIPWAEGKSLVWDFTCTDGLAKSYISQASVEPLYAASMAEDKKRRKYGHLSHVYTFAPVAVECFGSLGLDSLKLLRKIGGKIAEVTGERRAVEYFFQRISVAVQRGNAACVLGTIPPSASLEELFNIL